MFELLLEKDKRSIKREYLSRFFIVILYFLSVVGIFWIVASIPAFLLITTEQDIIENELEQLSSQALFSEKEILAEDFRLLRNKIDIFELEETYITGIIGKVTETLTDQTALRSINYRVSNQAQILEIQGIAQSRRSVTDLSDRLEQVPEFAEVKVPFSDFARVSDIPFSVMIILDDNGDDAATN